MPLLWGLLGYWPLGCCFLAAGFLAAFFWVFLAACFIATGFLAAFFAAFFSVFGPTDEVRSYGFALVRLSVSQLVREIPLIRIFFMESLAFK